MDTAFTPPVCGAIATGEATAHEMQRIVSLFLRHLTEADKVAAAEAKYGKEVNAALGATPDVGKLSRRYEGLAKSLPRPDDR